MQICYMIGCEMGKYPYRYRRKRLTGPREWAAAIILCIWIDFMPYL